MSAFSCSSCRHVNPPGSKFCNECGSPLRLTPCRECEALNDVGSATCHLCGAALAPSTTTPRPVENRTPSFEERLEALRRDFGIAREPAVATRAPAPVNIAPAPSVPTPLADRSFGVRHKDDSTQPAPVASSTLITPSSMARAASSTPDAPPLPAPISPIVPAATSNPAQAPSSTTTADHVAQDHDPRVESPSGFVTASPAAPSPAEPRTVPPRLLYVLGAGLIFVGVAGYLYSLYGASDRIEQWLGALRQPVASDRSALQAPAQSTAPTVDAKTPSAPASGETGIAPRTGDATTTVPVATALPSSAPMSEGPRDAGANSAPVQTAAPTTAESPVSSSAIQTSPATESAPADASKAPTVASAAKKHTSRAKKRAGTRKTAPSQPATGPQAPPYVPAAGE